MEFKVLDWERPLLRSLAEKQAAYAALPEMKQRERMWRAVNMGHAGARPPVVIEEWTFNRDFMPEGIMRCESELGRQIEHQILSRVRSHELIGDDKVVPSTFQIGWSIELDEFGMEIPRDYVKDADGIVTGYHFHHPIKDLRRDISLLKPVSIRADREKTFSYQAFLNDLFGDVLPVEIVCSGGGLAMFLTHRVIELMGMEAFFTSMFDYPDETHALMEYLTQNALTQMRYYEAEGLLRVNNGNHDSFGSSYNFTDELPAPDYAQGPYRLKDMWLSSNSQETVGVSPSMFHEFCFPYYYRVCEPAGLLYYGCCEPASPFWEKSLSKLPHLKKISISRWCDERFMGEALSGTPIVYSRKPDPNYLSVDQTLDEEAWAAHIRTTLDATRDCLKEFIIRDVYTLHGNIGNAKAAVDIARREIDRAGY
jgi:hypothetical protein